VYVTVRGLPPTTRVCDVAGIGGQMNDEGMICPTCTETVRITERCFET
jgi:hypothetical protein